MSDEELELGDDQRPPGAVGYGGGAPEAVDASEERPVDGDRFIRVRRATLETVIGLLASHAEQRRESTKVVEEIRRRIALAGHPAGADEDPEG